MTKKKTILGTTEMANIQTSTDYRMSFNNEQTILRISIYEPRNKLKQLVKFRQQPPTSIVEK